jgi:flagellin
MRPHASLKVITGLFFFLNPPIPLHAANETLDFLNRILNGAESGADMNIERLSSGKILITDDPAGYAVDQALEKFIRGLDRTNMNRADMISYYTLQESMLGTIIEILQRIRELALQETNGTLSDQDRGIVEQEMRQQYDEILYVLSQAEFNTKKIFSELAGSEAVGAYLAEPKFYRIENVDPLIDFFITQRGMVGALMAGLKYSIAGDQVASENMTGARTALDTEYGSEVSAFERNQLLIFVNLLMLSRNVPSPGR